MLLYDGRVNAINDAQRINYYSYDFETLENLGLVQCAWTEGHLIEDVRITSRGRLYIDENPHLRNPVDFLRIAEIIIILISAVAAVLSLFISFSLKYS